MRIKVTKKTAVEEPMEDGANSVVHSIEFDCIDANSRGYSQFGIMGVKSRLFEILEPGKEYALYILPALTTEEKVQADAIPD